MQGFEHAGLHKTPQSSPSFLSFSSLSYYFPFFNSFSTFFGSSPIFAYSFPFRSLFCTSVLPHFLCLFFFVSFSLVLSNPSNDSLMSGCLKGISAPPSDCDNSSPSLCLLHILYFLFHWLMG